MNAVKTNLGQEVGGKAFIYSLVIIKKVFSMGMARRVQNKEIISKEMEMLFEEDVYGK